MEQPDHRECLLRARRERPRRRAAKQGNELAPSHEVVSDEVHNLAHHRTTRAPVHCTKNAPAYVGSGVKLGHPAMSRCSTAIPFMVGRPRIMRNKSETCGAEVAAAVRHVRSGFMHGRA